MLDLFLHCSQISLLSTSTDLVSGKETASWAVITDALHIDTINQHIRDYTGLSDTLIATVGLSS